jgi:hypothetical protein
MKRIIFLIAIVGSVVLTSCEGPQGDTGYSAESAVLEYPHVNLTLDQNGDYTFYRQISSNLEDNVVIYRLSGTIDSQTPIWQPIPRTLYLDNGKEFDYDYDFSREDFKIYARGNYNIETTPNYLYNQTFRVVIIPGNFANKGINLTQMDYKSLIAKFDIDDTKIKTMR